VTSFPLWRVASIRVCCTIKQQPICLPLAKAEVTEAASNAKAGAVSLLAGAVVIFAGILVLLAAFVFLLAKVVELWLAALIVGAVVVIAGFVLLQSGKKKLDPAAFKPERTTDALRKDKEMVQRRAS
jgi:xanthine/uracil permease